MARTLCIPASVLLLVALVLSLLVSLSLPFLPTLDIVRVLVADNGAQASIEAMNNIRLGIWTACAYALDGTHACGEQKLGYEVIFVNIFNTADFEIIQPSWTRGLVVHPIATGFIFVAFFVSFSERMTANLVAFFMSSFAALITLVAFAFDIALFVHVRNAIKDLDAGASTEIALGFWLTFVSYVVVNMASAGFFFGRRRQRRSNASTNYPMETPKSGKFWAKLHEVS
ncbi:SUR7/PalI family-domain-containing protein [Pholiota molesta]|nr:SUR7/PalI family-domain-containing protein [Pholiota molesta]